MSRTSNLRATLVVLATLGPAGVLAAEHVAMERPPTIMSGGVGFASQQDLKSHEREFNLKLVFTLTEGNYVADVDVVIRDAGGKTVMTHEADGPLVLARLPRGSYTVSATYEGRTQTRRVSVGESLLTAQFRWPSNPQTDFPLAEDRG